MTIATIISISGQAWARDEAGNLRELRVGDTLQEGETLVTSDNGRVQLDFGDGLDPTVIDGGQEVVMTPDLDTEQPVAAEDASVQDADLEALLTALDEGEGDILEDLAATAAGAGGAGGEGGGHDFVRLARITENVNPLSYEYGLASLGAIPDVEGQAIEELAPDEPDSFPTVDTIDLDGDGDMVWESALPETGSGGGTLTTSGTFQIDTGTDLLALIEVQDAAGNWIGIGADGTQVTGAYGILTVNTDGSWSYTLTQSADHPAQGETGEADQLADTFAVRATDDDGDVSAPATLAIDINDDAPTAQDDTASLQEDGEIDVVSGNVLANDASGADAPASFVGWGDNSAALAELAKYGTLTLDANGDYRFELDNSDPDVQALTASDSISETLSYTMRDADGDTSPASLTITINGAADSAQVTVSGEGADSTVYEAGLSPDGSDAANDSETDTGSFGVSATDGIASVTVGGTTFTLAELQTFTSAAPSSVIDTGEGSLVITGYDTTDGHQSATLSYAYTLDASQTHSVQGNDRVSDSVAVSVSGT
ncbi:retention module-containing protein, partial [Halomonas sp. 11-S5]|uniref:retention module-containing protein n=1 Tax=Halomonas sp. 11-S5 TaxID=2994064 RepID=UPI002468D2D6